MIGRRKLTRRPDIITDAGRSNSPDQRAHHEVRRYIVQRHLKASGRWLVGVTVEKHPGAILGWLKVKAFLRRRFMQLGVAAGMGVGKFHGVVPSQSRCVGIRLT